MLIPFQLAMELFFLKCTNFVHVCLINSSIQRWYKRDENAVPPVYALTQISKFLPDFLSTDAKKMRAASNQFWEENDIMQNALETAASQVLGPEQARKYVISGTPHNHL